MLHETIMTYSEEAALRGRQEGILEGMEKMAKNFLANGFSPEAVAKSADWPVERVRALIS